VRPPAAGKGRPKGALNKATREIRELAQALFDDAYWERCRARLLSGRIAPAVEAKLLAYAYGEPKQQLEVQGDVNVQTIVKHIYQGMDAGGTH
jgi:hypothetical protein